MKASKLLSVLLIVAMCFSFMAVSASAEGAVIIFGGADAAGESQGTAALPESTPEVQSGSGSAGAAVVEATEPENDEKVLEGVIAADDVLTTAPEEEEVVPAGKKAAIGKEYYDSLNAALDAAKDGDTVKLLSSIVRERSLVIDKSITLDLNSFELTFRPKEGAEAAVDVAAENAAIKNGGIVIERGTTTVEGQEQVFGFETGIRASERFVLDVDLEYAGPEGGTMLDGKVVVVGGSYSEDPSDFLGEDYKATEKDGAFVVEEEEVVIVPEYYASIGGDKYESVEAAIAAAQAGDTVLVLNNAAMAAAAEVNANITLDLNGKTLTGNLSVAAGKSLALKNGVLTGNIVSSGALSLEGAAIGNITLNAGSLSVADAAVSAGEVSVKGSGVTGNVTAGSFKAIPEELIAEGYKATKDGDTYTVAKIPATGTVTIVKDGYAGEAGKPENAYAQHFKGAAESTKNDNMEFKVEPGLFKLYLNGTELKAGTDYTYSNSVVAISKDASFLNDLPAGKNEFKFVLDNGAEESALLYVMPSAVFENSGRRYVRGSDIVVTLSDIPDTISFGSSDNKTDVPEEFLSKTDSGVVTIKSEYVDKLAVGTHQIGFWYGDSVLMYAVSIASAASVTPADDSNEAKWLNSGDSLNFKVSPDVKSVSVDGTVVSADKYSFDKGVLALKSAFLKSLKYGEHTLSVETSDGTASVKFTTASSVKAKDAATHTLGGSKDLVFTSSDPVSRVFVGETELTKAEQFSISTDGKTITLKAAFLNKLKADRTYTLSVVGDAGKAVTTFKILSPESAAANPKTGDNSSIVLWASVLVLSGAAVAALLPKKKKQ